MLAPASDFHGLVSGCLSPFASALPLAMCALLCWCALAVGVAVGSLHDNEPMQADEPPIVRGDPVTAIRAGPTRGTLCLPPNCTRFPIHSSYS